MSSRKDKPEETAEAPPATETTAAPAPAEATDGREYELRAPEHRDKGPAAKVVGQVAALADGLAVGQRVEVYRVR